MRQIEVRLRFIGRIERNRMTERTSVEERDDVRVESLDRGVFWASADMFTRLVVKSKCRRLVVRLGERCGGAHLPVCGLHSSRYERREESRQDCQLSVWEDSFIASVAAFSDMEYAVREEERSRTRVSEVVLLRRLLLVSLNDAELGRILRVLHHKLRERT
jgi:hypothetical protein